MSYKSLLSVALMMMSIVSCHDQLQAQSEKSNNGLIKMEYLNPIYFNNGHVNSIAHRNWSGYRVTPTIQINNLELGVYLTVNTAKVSDKSYIFDSRSTVSQLGLNIGYNLSISPELDIQPIIGGGTSDIKNQAKTLGFQYHGGMNLIYALNRNIQFVTSIQYHVEQYDVQSNERLLTAFEKAHALIPSIGIQLSTGM